MGIYAKLVSLCFSKLLNSERCQKLRLQVQIEATSNLDVAGAALTGIARDFTHPLRMGDGTPRYTKTGSFHTRFKSLLILTPELIYVKSIL